VYAVTSAASGYVKSARQGGRDALREGVVVPEEGSPELLEVTIGSHSGGFETTLDPGNAIAAEAVKVAFLRQTPVGLHLEHQTSIQTRTSLAGVNRFPGFRSMSISQPGEYVVVAWTSDGAAEKLPYNEPGFLERYASLIEHTTLGETGRQPVVIHHLLPEIAFEKY